MARAVTSGDLDGAGEALRGLRDALEKRAEDFGDLVSDAREARDLFDRCWGGPLPDRLHEQIDAYVEAIAGASGAADSARDTVRRWATRAEELSGELASTESWLESTIESLNRPGQEDNSALIDDRRTASSRLSELSGAWASACGSFSDELSPAITELVSCSEAMFGTPGQRDVVSGDAYYTALALWAHTQVMPFDVLDPSGSLQAEADRRLDEFANGEFAELQYVVVETMSEGDIRLTDGESTLEDWRYSADFTIVRYRLEMAANLAGLELDDETLDALALQIVTTAIFTTGSASDHYEDVDDEVDPDAAVAEALGDKAAEDFMTAGGGTNEPPSGPESAVDIYINAGGGTTNPPAAPEYPTEIDYELPSNPTEEDLYIESWLNAKLAPEESTGWALFMVGYSFFVPDFAAMNPFSDDFSPVWAAVEIVGIGNPIDEGAGVLRAGRRLADGTTTWMRGADELVEGITDGMRGADELTDAGRVLDEDVLAGTDEVLEGADDVAPTADEVTDSSDELTTATDDAADSGDSATTGADDTGSGSQADADDASDADASNTSGEPLTEHSTPSSRELGENLEDAGFERPPGSAAHHIVAGNAPAADEAREILLEFGIDINDADNGVFLPANTNSPNPTGASVHSTLHTNEYYRKVTDLLSEASTPEEAEAILGEIRQGLSNGDFP